MDGVPDLLGILHPNCERSQRSLNKGLEMSKSRNSRRMMGPNEFTYPIQGNLPEYIPEGLM